MAEPLRITIKTEYFDASLGVARPMYRAYASWVQGVGMDIVRVHLWLAIKDLLTKHPPIPDPPYIYISYEQSEL